MSTRTRKRSVPGTHAPVFAALGDDTRLTLVKTLAGGEPFSISRLATGSRLTRQAITKHLHVLERAGLVHSIRRGRENHFALDPAPLEHAKTYLDFVSAQWDEALSRLKKYVER